MDFDINMLPGMDSDEMVSVELSLFDISMRLKEGNLTSVWGWGIGGSVVCEVLIKDGVAYFGACDKNFYAVDAKTGRELWRFSAGDVIWNFDMEKDRIYFSCHDGCVYAITSKGKLIWKFEASDKISCKPTIAGNNIYFVTRDGSLYCLEKQKGNLKWRFHDGTPSCADPLIVDGIVYVGFNSGNCYAINPDGSIKWKYAAKGPVDSACHDKGLFFFPSIDGNFYTFDSKGRLVWRFASRHKNLTWKQPLIMDGVIYFTTIDDVMFALKTDGKLLWKINTGNEVVTPPFIRGPHLYFGTIEGELVKVDRRTGDMVSKENLSGKIIVTKNHGDSIYFSCYDSKVICTDLEGKIKWVFSTSIGYASAVTLDKVISEIEDRRHVIEMPSLMEGIDLYKPSISAKDMDSESIYGGLNMQYASGTKYKAKFKYGH